MHRCSYCGIEYDPSEVMCPACGHKTEKSAFIPKEKKPEKIYIEEEKKEIKEKKGIEIDEKNEKKEKSKIHIKKPEDSRKKEEKKEEKKDTFYKKALSRLEKSLFKGKKKEKPVPPKKSRSKKAVSSLSKLFYFSRVSYIVWFFIGFTGLTLLSGYSYAFVGWFEKFLKLLFTSDIPAEAELLNIHHRFTDLFPGSFFILNGDVLLFVPVLSCIIPLVMWIIKNRSGGSEIAGNSNIFAGLGFSLVLSVFVMVILRSVSFNYTFYDIILAVALFAPILDLGILVYAFKPGGFRLNQTIIVLLYNTGIPILFIVISMAYDFFSILI